MMDSLHALHGALTTFLASSINRFAVLQETEPFSPEEADPRTLLLSSDWLEEMNNNDILIGWNLTEHTPDKAVFTMIEGILPNSHDWVITQERNLNRRGRDRKIFLVTFQSKGARFTDRYGLNQIIQQINRCVFNQSILESPSEAITRLKKICDLTVPHLTDHIRDNGLGVECYGLKIRYQWSVAYAEVYLRQSAEELRGNSLSSTDLRPICKINGIEHSFLSTPNYGFIGTNSNDADEDRQYDNPDLMTYMQAVRTIKRHCQKHFNE
jgi:hypothetical protein